MTDPGLSMPAVFPLVMFCAECGNVLEVARGGKINRDAKNKIEDSARYEFGHAQHIALLPCRGCIEKATAPAKALIDALKGFKE